MYYIKEYNNEYLKQWDNFVLKESVNGTFLQTMNFLNYHDAGKFEDASFMVFDDEKLIAVIPGCAVNDEKGKGFFSHRGTSYGGIILKKSIYSSQKTIEVVKMIDNYLKDLFDYCILKITPDLFCQESTDLLQYALYYSGFNVSCELSTYIDLQHFNDEVLEEFDRNKKRNIKKCIEKGLSFKTLCYPKEIERFHQLLTINLKKHNAKPIHTLADLNRLFFELIGDKIVFFGVFDKDVMVSAGMLFDFEGNVLHAQNLVYDISITDYSPISFLYYKVIEYAKLQNYKTLSWGISTENNGRTINMGLIRNKESYGSKYQINRTYYKRYSVEVPLYEN